MRKIAVAVMFSLFFSFGVSAADQSNLALLSQLGAQVKMSWLFLQNELMIVGTQANGQPIFIQNNLVRMEGVPGCDNDCSGVLSIDGQNNLFLNVYKPGSDIIKTPINKAPIKIGETDENGEIKSIDKKFKFDVLMAKQPRTISQWYTGQPSEYRGVEIILHVRLSPQDYSDRKF